MHRFWGLGYGHLFRDHYSTLGFPDGLVVKNLPVNAGDNRRHEFDPWARKVPWRKVFLPGNSSGQRSLVGYGP